MLNETVARNDTNQTSNFINSTSAYVGVVDPPAWSVNLFIAFQVTIMVLAVTGNGLILVVEQFNKQKTSTDWLVTFMSVNDIVLAGVNVPIYILLYNGSWTSVGSNFLCGMMTYIQEGFSFSSTLLLTVTALDRYIKTCHPHATGITSRRSMYICIGVTMFAMAFCAVIPYYVVYDAVRKCKFDITVDARTALRSMMIFLQGTYGVSFLVVIVSYCKIAITIRIRIRALKKRNNPVQPSEARRVSHGETSTSQAFFSRLPFRDTKVTPLPSQSVETVTHLPSISEKGTAPGVDVETKCTNIGQVHPPQVVIAEKCKEETEPDSNIQNIPISSVQLNDAADDARKSKEVRRNRKVQKNEKEAQMNKTTAIMFAVTVVFIVSWVPPWMAGSLFPNGGSDSVEARIGLLFCRRLFMINTCTNPLFYIGMSSVFRRLTKQTMAKLSFRIQEAFRVIRGP